MNQSSSQRRKRFVPREVRRFLRPPPGSVPGTVSPRASSAQTTIHAISFREDQVEEHLITNPDELQALLRRYAVTWISIAGLKHVELVHRVAQIFNIHGLALEDSFNLHQRAKAEPYDQHLYLVANMLRADPEQFFHSDQISLFVGSNYVLTIRDVRDDCLEPVRERVRRQAGKLRMQSADYLAYSIIDTIIDHYFPIAEQFAEMIDGYEDAVLTERSPSIIKDIYEFKAHMDSMYQLIWNHKEMINFIIRHETDVVSEDTKIYFRDCHDHTMQLLDFLRASREAAADLVRLYLNLDTQRSNEVMKFLTLIASLFLPLTFITGLYGMNFRTDVSPWNMPELNWYLGYPFSLLLMTISTVGLIVYFRYKRWISLRSIWQSPSSLRYTHTQYPTARLRD